jgi:DNA-binding response OmpR family regulator
LPHPPFTIVAVTMTIDELEVRPDDGLVRVSGRTVVLSQRELEVLKALIERSGRLVRREELYELAWGRTLRPGDRSVDVYVYRLRTKLSNAADGRSFIHTHHGLGYRFEPEPPATTR